jgi:chromosome partitioning protein
MPTISFANPKGGAGKTTSALLLACELAEKNATVSIIDADPQRWISQWAALPGKPDNIHIVNDVSEDTIVDAIEEAAALDQFVIVDLEGTANLAVAHAIGMSDFVIIPAQGTSMDAKGAVKTVKLINNQARLARREIPHAVLITRTSALITSRSLKSILDQLDGAGVEVFATSIVERAAYRDLLDFGGTLSTLNPAQVSNIDKAQHNAREFTAEVIAKLKKADTAGKAA